MSNFDEDAKISARESQKIFSKQQSKKGNVSVRSGDYQELYFDEYNNKAFIDPNENIEKVNLDDIINLTDYDPDYSAQQYQKLESRPVYVEDNKEYAESYYRDNIGPNSSNQREELKIEMLQSESSGYSRAKDGLGIRQGGFVGHSNSHINQSSGHNIGLQDLKNINSLSS